MDLDEVLQQTLEKMAWKHPKEDRAKHEALLRQVFEEDQLPKDAMNFSPKMMEGLYGQGYILYNAGKYEQASHLFKMLIALDPSKYKYAMGLGGCFQMLKRYEDAIRAYMLGYTLAPGHPMPFYYIAECYIKEDQPRCAIIALENLLEKAGEDFAYVQLAERARLMLEKLREEVTVLNSQEFTHPPKSE